MAARTLDLQDQLVESQALGRPSKVIATVAKCYKMCSLVLAVAVVVSLTQCSILKKEQQSLVLQLEQIKLQLEVKFNTISRDSFDRVRWHADYNE